MAAGCAQFLQAYLRDGRSKERIVSPLAGLIAGCWRHQQVSSLAKRQALSLSHEIAVSIRSSWAFPECGNSIEAQPDDHGLAILLNIVQTAVW